MRAAIRNGFIGSTCALASNHAAPEFLKETTNKDDVYVKVNSSAINPIDYKAPRMMLGSVFGQDFCGIVTEVGSNCRDKFQIGDQVFGNAKGTTAEYTVAAFKKIAKAPSDWKPSDCAALPTAYQSALQCLRRGNIIGVAEDEDSWMKNAGEKSVLVIGASGGCGVAGLQLCRAAGVSRVVAICSKKNESFVKEIGGDNVEVLDYSNQDEFESFFFENTGKFDCVYDAATNSGGGEDYWNKSIDLLKRNENGAVIGVYTALNGSASKWIRQLAIGKQKTKNENLIMMDSNTGDLNLVISLLNRIEARPFTLIMPFTEEGVVEAYNLLKSRRAKGKIVVVM